MPKKYNCIQNWKTAFLKEVGSEAQTTNSAEYKALYTKEDLTGIEFHKSFPGFAPFVRGSKASMYTNRPWTIRQYAGFSNAEDTNQFFKKILSEGGQGISVAFDLPTHRGFDSDHPDVVGDVGKAGVAIDTVEDMKRLFADIDLGEVSVSMTMSGSVLPIMACYIVAAEEQGVSLNKLKGTIQNDILKEFMVRNTYIFPPGPSLRIASDVIMFSSKNLPKFNPISISGYHIQEAGGDTIIELAYTLANGMTYVDTALKAGLQIDDFAPRLSFFFGVGMDFYKEIAKLRAARLLWSKIISTYHPKNESSKILRMHCQTSGWSLTKDQPLNNIVRTTLEAMAAIFGGTQSLHTNSFDEALALPSDSAARVARNTQLILQHESHLTSVIDPWGGSFMMESLTQEIAQKAWLLIEEIQRNGGVLKTIESGVAKLEIEKCAAKKQSLIDQGSTTIIGVNKFIHHQQITDDLDIFSNDNWTILNKQMTSLQDVKLRRDSETVKKSLQKITEAASNNKDNLLSLTIDAIRARATVGEVTQALEKVWGRYQAPINIASGVYAQQFKDSDKLNELHNALHEFTKTQNIRPQILISKLGQDGHDRGAKVIAAGLKDLGFEVVYTPLFSSPQQIFEIFQSQKFHFVGCSSLAGGHNTLVPELLRLLKSSKNKDFVFTLGGIIPHKDHEALKAAGVQHIFEPGISVIDSAFLLLRLFTAQQNANSHFQKHLTSA